MGVQIFDSNGDLVIPNEVVASPDQQVADRDGNLVNPAEEDGNLLSIKNSTDNLDTTLSSRATEATVSTLSTESTLSTRASEATLSSLNSKVTAVNTGNVTIGAALPPGTNTIGNINALAGGSPLSATGSSLNVNVTGGSSAGPTDTDDNNIAGGQNVGLSTGLNYGWAGLNWERINSTSGSLDVNITGGSSSGPTDTDDGAVSTGQNSALGISMQYGYNGVEWERVRTTANALNVHISSSVVNPIDNEDGSITAGQSSRLGIAQNYGFNGSTWERIVSASGRLKVDAGDVAISIGNQPSVNIQDGAGNDLTSTIVGSDRALDVNIVAGAGGQEDTEDGNVSTGQTAGLTIGLTYGYNGVNWERVLSSSGRLIVDASQVAIPVTDNAGSLTVDQATHDNFNANVNIQVNNVDASKTNTVPVTLVSTGGHEPMVRVAAASVPSSYGVGAQLTTTALRNSFQVRNDTNQTILISINGTTDHHKLLKNEFLTVDTATIPSGNSIRVRHDGSAPTTGEVTLSAWSNG